MAVTNLTGYTWVANNELGDYSYSKNDFNVNFISNSNNYEFFYFRKDGSMLEEIEYGSTGVWAYGSWSNNAYKTVEFTGGNNITHTDLISWLEENGTLTPPAPAGYSITFEENGGTEQTDLTEQTNLPNPLPILTKDGHVFVAWYLDSMFTQKAVAGATVESNVTLYAKWYSVSGWFSDVADSIREKEGTIEPIRKVDFPERIRALKVADSDPLITVHAFFDFTPSGSTPGTITWSIPSALLDKLYCYRYRSGSHEFYKLSDVYLVGQSVSGTSYTSRLNTATGSFSRNVSTNGKNVGFCPYNSPAYSVSPGIVGLLCIIPPDESVDKYSRVSFKANNGAIVEVEVRKCEIPKSLLDQYYPGFNESMIKRFDIYDGAFRLANNDGW